MGSFDCDSRTFRIIEKGYLVSLSTTGKRVKVPMRVSRYHAERLKGQNPTSAQVCLHKDGQFYLHVQIKSEPPKVEPTDDVIGVDFGRRDIAVTSTGKSWSSETLNRTRDRFSRVRASLQRKASQGTRTSRRRCREILKRLSGRERRFQTARKGAKAQKDTITLRLRYSTVSFPSFAYFASLRDKLG